MLEIKISASTVAWYAALIGTFGGLKALYDLWTDRSRIKIEWLFDMNITGQLGKYFLVRVINKGRRPVKITHVAVKLYGEKEIGLLGHSFTNEEKRILTEEHPSTEYPTVQKNISPKNLWYVVVYDARGREYRSYNKESTPFLKRLWYLFTKPRTNKKVGGK